MLPANSAVIEKLKMETLKIPTRSFQSDAGIHSHSRPFYPPRRLKIYPLSTNGHSASKNPQIDTLATQRSPNCKKK
jgi:hypothetical protein